MYRSRGLQRNSSSKFVPKTPVIWEKWLNSKMKRNKTSAGTYKFADLAYNKLYQDQQVKIWTYCSWMYKGKRSRARKGERERAQVMMGGVVGEGFGGLGGGV